MLGVGILAGITPHGSAAAGSSAPIDAGCTFRVNSSASSPNLAVVTVTAVARSAPLPAPSTTSVACEVIDARGLTVFAQGQTTPGPVAVVAGTAETRNFGPFTTCVTATAERLDGTRDSYERRCDTP